MDVRDMTSNILYFYRLATASDLQEKDWYRNAHAACMSESARLGVDFCKFVSAVAVLSPGLNWNQNIRAATQLAEWGWTRYGYRGNHEKALLILQDGDLTALQGPKVTRFAESIIDPARHEDTVVVDRHAIRAAQRRLTGDARITKAEYSLYESAYRQAAAEVGLKPSELQAVVWTVIRNLSRRHGQLSLGI